MKLLYRITPQTQSTKGRVAVNFKLAMNLQPGSLAYNRAGCHWCAPTNRILRLAMAKFLRSFVKTIIFRRVTYPSTLGVTQNQ